MKWKWFNILIISINIFIQSRRGPSTSASSSTRHCSRPYGRLSTCLVGSFAHRLHIVLLIFFFIIIFVVIVGVILLDSARS